VCGLALPATAFAHAQLLRTVPAAGSVVATAPRQFVLEFDQQVEPVTGSTDVVNAAGRSVLAGPARTSAADVQDLVIPLHPGLPRGDYTVRWSVVSTDGHIVSGVFAIAVGRGSPPPQAATAESSPYDWPYLVARFCYFAGLMLLIGGAVFRAAVLMPALAQLPDQRRRAAEARERDRGNQLFLLAAVVMLGGGWVALNRQGAEVAGVSFWQAFNHAGPIPSALQATRFGRVFGRGIDLGAAFVVSIPVTWILLRRSRLAGLAAAAVATALGVWAVVVPGLSGHAGDPGLGLFAVIVDAVHTAAAAVWIGGLAQLVRVVPHATRGLPDDLRRPTQERIVRRFSTIALGSVIVVAVTGGGRALWEVSSVGQIVSTGYGRALLAKTLLLLAAVVVAAGNRRRLARFDRVRLGAATELLLLTGVIAAVALLTDLPPANTPLYAAQPAPRATPPAGGVTRVALTGRGRLTVWPGRAGPNAVAVRLPGHAPSVQLLIQTGSATRTVTLPRVGADFAGFVVLAAGRTQLEVESGGLARGASFTVGRASSVPVPVPGPAGSGAVAAEEAGDLAVGLQREPGGTAQVTLIDAEGGGVPGALATVDGQAALPCVRSRPACFTAPVPAAAGAVEVVVRRPGIAPVRARIDLPAADSPLVPALLRRASAAYAALRSVRSENVLASSPTVSVTTSYVSQRPDRLLIDVHGENHSVIIGTRRWTQPAAGGPWTLQTGLPRSSLPNPFWLADSTAVHLAGTVGPDTMITFVSTPPGTAPAFFRLWIDRRSGEVVRLRMITTAHFMWECETDLGRGPLLEPPPSRSVDHYLATLPDCSPAAPQ
jgi:copper transport protein